MRTMLVALLLIFSTAALAGGSGGQSGGGHPDGTPIPLPTPPVSSAVHPVLRC
jgi:hypothetical protein